jgi:flagellar biosynthesis protein FlhB
MSDDQGTKTEAPTHKKREEAKKKGQVPRSTELTTAVLLFSSAGVLQATTADLAKGLSASLQRTWASVASMPVDPAGVGGLLGSYTTDTLRMLGPTVLSMAAMALVVAGIQARGVLSTDPLKMKGEKINPLTNAKKVWGMKAVVEFVKTMGKFAVIGAVTGLIVAPTIEGLPVLAQSSPVALLLTVKSAAVKTLAGAGVAYLIIAAADYGFQIFKHEKDLKMSKDEVRRENKEQNGDPSIKARRRTLARSLARRRMLLSVSDADVVITNPIHFAVAIKYDPGKAPAPIILAKGERKMAARIKQIAKDNGVQVIEDVPLARALYASAEVGEMVPVTLFMAVAEILAFVFRQRTRGRAGVYAEA